jgi:MraZ protein
MNMLIGKEFCKVDGNGRFKLPSAHKKLLSAMLEEGFIIRESLFDACLELWPRKEFERETSEKISNLNPYNPKDRLIIRKLSEGNPVELDANDRILIPNDQKKSKKIDKDIVLIPTGSLIEIWDISAYEAINKSTTANIADMIAERLGGIRNENEDSQ